VIDNVSGEDWKRVAVGVGSTSALSFRYDLHSVRYVERETLKDGSALGAAPPTGGSPYAVAGKELQVLANVSRVQLMSDEEVVEAAPSATSGSGAGAGAPRVARKAGPRAKSPSVSLDDSLQAWRLAPARTRRKSAWRATRCPATVIVLQVRFSARTRCEIAWSPSASRPIRSR
jgi:hypothetical protein